MENNGLDMVCVFYGMALIASSWTNCQFWNYMHCDATDCLVLFSFYFKMINLLSKQMYLLSVLLLPLIILLYKCGKHFAWNIYSRAYYANGLTIFHDIYYEMIICKTVYSLILIWSWFRRMANKGLSFPDVLEKHGNVLLALLLIIFSNLVNCKVVWTHL